MKLTREHLDWAASESKSKYPGKLMTVAINSWNDLGVYPNVDSMKFKKEIGWDDAATFLNGERYYAEAYSREVKRDSKGHQRSEEINNGSVESTGGAE